MKQEHQTQVTQEFHYDIFVKLHTQTNNPYTLVARESHHISKQG